MTRGTIAPTLLMFVLAATPALAQVTAKQGEARSDTRQRFRSPMVLEVPAGPLLALERGDSWSFPEVGNYLCEDAWLRDLKFKRTRAREGELEYEVEGFILVADSFDREVAVHFDFLDGERVAGGGHKDRIDAEEQKTTRFWFKLYLAADAASALRSSPAPTLRLTLELLQNGIG